MADDVLNVEVQFTGDAALLARAIEKGITDAGADAVAKLTSLLDGLGRRDFGRGTFRGLTGGADKAKERIEVLRDSIDAIKTQADGVEATLGDAFDPRSIALVNVQLQEVARLQDIIANNPGLEGDDLRELNTALRATQQQLEAADIAFKESARAAIQADKDKAESARQTARSEIVTKQQQGKAESDAVRTSAQLQIAATQSAARTRVARIQAASRAIQSIERGLRTAFQGTAQVISSAFRSFGRVGAAAASQLRRTVTTNNTQIRNSYNETFNSSRRSIQNNTQEGSVAIQRFRSNAVGALGEVGGAVDSLGQKVDGLNAKTVALAGVLGVGIAKALRGGFERATTIETAERTLTLLTGSAEEAATILTEIDRIVTGTPFRFDQFAQGASRLIAFNVEADRIPGILESIGDAAAASGKDANQTIDTLIRVTGQATATGKLYGDQLLQLGEAGINALDIIGNEFGVLSGEVQELLTDGTIPADAALTALFKGIDEGSDGVNGATVAFGGLAQELGGTLSGAVTNFGTSIDRLGANLFETFTPAIVAASSAATKAVDLIGSALNSLAKALVASPVFRLIQEGIAQLGPALDAAEERLRPVFDFIADGLVTLGTALGGLRALRAIPGLFSAIGFAVARILTPFNLLVTAGVLLAGFFNRLVEGSVPLQKALESLGFSLGVLRDLAVALINQGLDILSAAFDGLLTPAVNAFAEVVEEILLPLLERLNNFLTTQVIPAFVRFATFIRERVFPVVATVLTEAVDLAVRAFRGLVRIIRETVIPIVRDGLTRALSFLRSAFQAISDFVRDQVIPVVGPILARAVEIGKAAFESIYDFLRNEFLPFVQNNLVPVVAGLTASLAAFAITGNPFAGLAVAFASTIAIIASNDDLRNAIVDKVKDAVETAREFIGNLFDDGVLANIAVGALRVAERIGRILGDIVSDPRVLGTVAAIAAFAAALAGSFVLGFARGIVENIPSIVEAISDALQAALQEVITDPKLALILAGGLFSAIAISRLVRSARQAGQLTSRAFAAGAQGGFQGGALGAGTGARGFLSGLFGSPAQIRAQADKVATTFTSQVQRRVQQNQRLLQRFGSPASLAQNISGGRYGALAGSQQNLRKTEAALRRIERLYGKAAVAGQRFRLGLQDLGNRQIRSGLGQIGEAIRSSGAAIAGAAGALAGGAFAASFISEAIFALESTGQERITSTLGLIATSIGSGAVVGGAAGVAVGAAVAGIGLFSSIVKRAGEDAKLARQRVKALADVLREADESGEDAGQALSNKVQDLINEADDNIRDALNDIDFDFTQFGEDLADGVLEPLANLNIRQTGAGIFTTLGEESAKTAEGLRDLLATTGPLGRSLAESDLSTTELIDTVRFLQTIIGDTAAATSDLTRENDLAANATLTRATQEKLAAGASDVAKEATQAYQDKLKELNQVRIDGLQERVDESKTALNEAEAAADDARSALQAFLSGETVQKGIQQSIDEATVSIGSLAQSITSSLSEGATLGGDELEATIRLKAGEAQAAAAEILAGGVLADGTPIVTEADAQAALAPLLNTAAAEGGRAGDEITAGINAAIAAFTSEDGKALIEAEIDAEGALAVAQTTLTNSENALQAAIELDLSDIANQFPSFAAAAKTEFEAVGEKASTGFADGFDPGPARDAAKEMANASLLAAETALDTGSPSKKFEAIGRFGGQGFAAGLIAEESAVSSAGRTLGTAAISGLRFSNVASQFNRIGRDAGIGFVIGVRSSSFKARLAGAALAQAAIDSARNTLASASPSRVFYEIGGDVVEGFAQGIEDETPRFITRASKTAERLVKKFDNVGKLIVETVGQGLADEGPAFISSIGSAMDAALDEALSRADQFKRVGEEIAANLFLNQGASLTGPDPFGNQRVNLELERISQQLEPFVARDNFQNLVDEFGPGAATFRNSGLGLINRSEFLQRGQDLREYIQLLLDSGVSAQAAVNEGKTYRDQLIGVARAYGATTQDIRELLATLGLTNLQLADFVKEVNNTTKAVKASTEAAEEQARLEEALAKQREAEAKAAEDRANAITPGISQPGTVAPVFRDLIVQPVAGNPEAIALATANKVAFNLRR